MLTSLGQALTQQNWKENTLFKKQAAQIIFNDYLSIDYVIHDHLKSKCIKCLSDKFVSKSKLHAQNQNWKYSGSVSWNN